MNVPSQSSVVPRTLEEDAPVVAQALRDMQTGNSQNRMILEQTIKETAKESGAHVIDSVVQVSMQNISE